MFYNQYLCFEVVSNDCCLIQIVHADPLHFFIERSKYFLVQISIQVGPIGPGVSGRYQIRSACLCVCYPIFIIIWRHRADPLYLSIATPSPDQGYSVQNFNHEVAKSTYDISSKSRYLDLLLFITKFLRIKLLSVSA